MKAQILYKPDKIEALPLKFENIPIPEPVDDEVLVKVEYCGVCRTDLHLVEGEIVPPSYPVIPGHQIIGKVEKMGAKVKKWKKGDKVGIPWFYSSCGKCKYCLSGKENLCESAKFTGFHVNGGFAEYVIAKENSLYHFPSKYKGGSGAPLLCGGVIGYRSLKFTETEEGDILGLYGFGASAHIVLQIALWKKVRVFVFTRSPHHQKLAQELGAEWVGHPTSSPPEKMDAAIIFAPAGELIPSALKNLNRGGRLILAGIYMTPTPPIEYSLLYEERIVRSVANSTSQDVKELLEIAQKMEIRTVTQLYPLEKANEALLDLKRSAIQASAVLEIG
ncbi:zinc-dependent alcohol dehydrogenase family protein [Candidatus Calescamantes bacterium]|nr:zinc-dependent alcohol dehydrogenase family protein [Candidatus Calescamantes bacterium]